MPRLIATRMRAPKARALLDLGEPASPSAHLTSLRPGPPSKAQPRPIQLAVERDDVAGARAVLDAWPRDGSSWSELNFSLARALVEDAAGDRRAALAIFAELLATTEPEGHVLLFIEAGPRAERLLRGALPRRSELLLAAARPARTGGPTTAGDVDR